MCQSNMSFNFKEQQKIQYECGLIDAIAADIHEKWRESWKKDSRNTNGNNPRIKNDEDINQNFANLTNIENKKENLMSATVAFNCVIRKMSRECAASIIHDTWVQRNHAFATDEQKQSYCLLPESEKDKDRVVFDIAMSHHETALGIVKILNDTSIDHLCFDYLI